MAEQVATLIANTESGVTRLETILEAAISGLDLIEKHIEAANRAAGISPDQIEALTDQIVAAAVDTVFDKIDSEVERANDLLDAQFVPVDVFETMTEEVFEAHDRAGQVLKYNSESLATTEDGLSGELTSAVGVLEDRASEWIQDVDTTAETVDERIAAMMDTVSLAAPEVDQALETVIADQLITRIDTIVDAASGYLDLAQATVDQSAGALEESIGAVGETVGSVAEVLETIRPATEAFEALS